MTHAKLGTKKPDLIVHVGLPKCASTTLQYNLFRHEQAWVYIASTAKGKKIYIPGYTEFQKEISGGDIVTASTIKNEILKSFSGPRHVFSDEGFVRWLEARQIHSIFSDAHFLIVLRNPVKYYESAYLQHLKGALKKDKICKSFSEYFEMQIEQSDDFRKVADLLLLRPDDCTFLYFEDLVTNNADGEWEDSLAHLLGVDKKEARGALRFECKKNDSLSQMQYWHHLIRMRYPRFSAFLRGSGIDKVKRFLSPLLPKRKASVSLSPLDLALISNATSSSISRINRFVERDLEALGYFD